MDLYSSPELTRAGATVEPGSSPMPAIQRGSMVPLPWAGSAWQRLRRLFAGRPQRSFAQQREINPWLWRRLWLVCLIALPMAVGARFMMDILPHAGTTPLEFATLLVFTVLFGWISAGFWTGVAGFVVLLLTGGERRLSRYAVGDEPISLQARTALIMPICNEDVDTVFAGLRATIDSVRGRAERGLFDFFVLSDTGNPDTRAAEQAAYGRLCEALGPDVRVYYRWRQRRTKRKAGNVADFCRRWGASYRYMVVLDADSVMTGSCLATLVRLMEAHPDAGILQTAPTACGHDTLHARAQQFAARVYGPLFTAGMQAWQLGESHYWGHNAILRVQPFMRHCALAPIEGSGSLSGEILSHDFVEAALMRRAGYKVWIAHDLPGSYEQFPPNLLAEVLRDRRWCQGNLQNARLMFEPGFHAVHRAVFLTGLLAYLSAPLWLVFLLLSSALVLQQALMDPQYFVEPHQLFPVWQQADFGLMITLFGLTAALLLVPKALALLLIVVQGQARRYGGARRLMFSGVLELLHSVLLAPIRMIFHSQFVLGALTGIRIGWQSPPRDDAATPWSVALRHHGPHMLFGAAWLAVLVWLSAIFPWWVAPVLAGLVLSAPLSVWSSHAAPGRFLRRIGLLKIPEERRLPRVLRQARQYLASAPPSVGFAEAVTDPGISALVARAVTGRPGRGEMVERAMHRREQNAMSQPAAALGSADRMYLLSSPAHLVRLAQAYGQALTSAAQPVPAQMPTDPSSGSQPARPERIVLPLAPSAA